MASYSKPTLITQHSHDQFSGIICKAKLVINLRKIITLLCLFTCEGASSYNK